MWDYTAYFLRLHKVESKAMNVYIKLLQQCVHLVASAVSSIYSNIM